MDTLTVREHHLLNREWYENTLIKVEKSKHIHKSALNSICMDHRDH